MPLHKCAFIIYSESNLSLYFSLKRGIEINPSWGFQDGIFLHLRYLMGFNIFGVASGKTNTKILQPKTPYLAYNYTYFKVYYDLLSDVSGILTDEVYYDYDYYDLFT